MTDKHTPTPWDWVIHDHSMASLGVLPDPGLGDPLVMTVSPCRACTDRADPKEWKWGRCQTPSKADAAFIVRACNSHDELVAALEAVVNHEVDPDFTKWGGIVDNATAVIAKAKGES